MKKRDKRIRKIEEEIAALEERIASAERERERNDLLLCSEEVYRDGEKMKKIQAQNTDLAARRPKGFANIEEIQETFRSHDYVAVLQAARSEIVDLTSFDYLTLDDDIAQAKRITTGDLQKEVVAQLNKTRADVTSAEAVVSTEVIGAAVTKADDEHGTVVLFIQSTQKNNQVAQAQVLQYQVEANLTKVGDRWLLSGIQGQG